VQQLSSFIYGPIYVTVFVFTLLSVNNNNNNNNNKNQNNKQYQWKEIGMKKWKERIGLRNHNKKTRNQDKRKQEIIPKERKKIETIFLTDENK